MVINDKKVYQYEADKGYLDKVNRISDEDGMVDITSIKEAFAKSLEKLSVNALIEEGEIKYKTGVMKSEKTICLIVSNKEKPKNYRQLVVAVKQTDAGYIVACGWYGESKADRLFRKAEKGHKRADKNAIKGDTRGGEFFLFAIFGRIVANSRVKRANRLLPVENAYHQSVREAYVAIFDNSNEA